MEQNERLQLIRSYKDGYQIILEAITDLRDGEIDAPAPDGGWTIREIIHHLGDSESASAMRLRRLIVEDSPQLQDYDQDEFARRLHYQDRPVENSLLAFQAARAATTEILERMSEEEWAGSGSHSESGPYSVTDWLRTYSAHASEHAEQIGRIRRKLK